MRSVRRIVDVRRRSIGRPVDIVVVIEVPDVEIGIGEIREGRERGERRRAVEGGIGYQFGPGGDSDGLSVVRRVRREGEYVGRVRIVGGKGQREVNTEERHRQRFLRACNGQ